MKKTLLLFVFACCAVVGFSQQLNFSKGKVKPGAISTPHDFEDFLIGPITITDENGGEYKFVKADFLETVPNSKEIRITLTTTLFPEENRSDIARGSVAGTNYTFSNVVVRDSNGKELIIPKVTYQFTGFR